MVGSWVGLHDRLVRPALGRAAAAWLPPVVLWWPDDCWLLSGPGMAIGSAARKGCAVAAQPSNKAAPELPRYLRAAEVAAILQVSPKTVSRWATEGKLPFLRTLGGHRRYPAAEIRQLAEELRVQPTA
jgi:excisionase family DNA binding protein